MTKALKVGSRVPDFRLEGEAGALLTPDSLDGSPYALVFYPGDDTPTCTNEMMSFSALCTDFRKLDVRIVGVSKDSAASHAKFKAKHGLTVELASDPDDGTVAAFGAWGKKTLFGREYMGILRSTVLIDKSRIVGLWRVARVAGHAEAVLAAARALARN